ncbi:hypothetical protein HK105_207823 [Polyrhizophydium stewartii]|uniref:Protein kinase domain-containing protein n=1 Tax=Polyrhizophydium stewartii TaxID=2732419 RepID=A0ABR4MZN6_9FUNG
MQPPRLKQPEQPEQQQQQQQQQQLSLSQLLGDWWKQLSPSQVGHELAQQGVAMSQENHQRALLQLDAARARHANAEQRLFEAKQRLERAEQKLDEAEQLMRACEDELEVAMQQAQAPEMIQHRKQWLDDARVGVQRAYETLQFAQQQYLKAQAAADKLEDAQKHEQNMLAQLQERQLQLAWLKSNWKAAIVIQRLNRGEQSADSARSNLVLVRSLLACDPSVRIKVNVSNTCLHHFLDVLAQYCDKNTPESIKPLFAKFIDFAWIKLYKSDACIPKLLAMESMITFYYSLAMHQHHSSAAQSVNAMQPSTGHPHAVQGSSDEIVTFGAEAQLAAHSEASETDMSAQASEPSDSQQPLGVSAITIDISASPPARMIVAVKFGYCNKAQFAVMPTDTVSDLLSMIASDPEGSDWIERIRTRSTDGHALYTTETWHRGGEPVAAEMAIGSIARTSNSQPLQLHLSAKEPKYSARDVLEHLGKTRATMGLSQLNEAAEEEEEMVDLLPLTKAHVKMHLASAASQLGDSSNSHGATGVSAIGDGAVGDSADALLDHVNTTTNAASSIRTAAADGAMRVLVDVLSGSRDLRDEKEIRDKVKKLLKAIALLLGQTSGVVDGNWLKDRGHKFRLAFVLTTPSGQKMIVAIEFKHGRLFDPRKPLCIDKNGMLDANSPVGTYTLFNEAFTNMAESGLNVSVITNLTQTVVLHCQLDSSHQLATTFSCVEDPSGQALFGLLFTLLLDARNNVYGEQERTFVQHKLHGDGVGHDAVKHSWHAARNQPLLNTDAPHWLAEAVDPATPSGCLRLREVPRLSAVPQQTICRTVDDALRLSSGFMPTDIFVGPEIGAGCFGVVCEGLFQGRPAAIKRIVMHLYFDNMLIYQHEVQVYLHLRSLWGTAVATLLSHGINSHKSVSIITERGSHSEEWSDSDIRLAVASLEMIHRMGILHGDSHAANVVFFGEGNSRRALWIDFERSTFDNKHDRREAEIQRLRKCAISIREKANKTKLEAERRLREALPAQ